MSGWVWLVIAAVFVIVEITNLALFALFLAIGAVAAALTAVAGGGIVTQAVVFAVTSVGGVMAVRRPLLRTVHGSRAPLRSGVTGLVGQRATVVHTVHGADHPGTVHVRGEDWPAISFDDVAYQPGQVVHVVDIDRTRLVVTIA